MNEPRISRREVLAFVALADAPMPLTVSFEWGHSEMVAVELDVSASVEVWAGVFGLNPDRIHRHDWVMDGVAYSSTSVTGTWRGWPVRIELDTRSPVEAELDGETRQKLHDIAEPTREAGA